MKKMVGIGAFMLAVLLTFNVDAQGNQNLRCINQISDLTVDQKTQITQLEQAYQLQMTEYRNARRSTTDLGQKNEIREKMDAARNNHRSEISSLLNENQQKQYAAFTDGKTGQGKGKNSGTCTGKKQGQNRVKAKGNGQGRNRTNQNS